MLILLLLIICEYIIFIDKTNVSINKRNYIMEKINIIEYEINSEIIVNKVPLSSGLIENIIFMN
ncbi:hypothetical protein HMPREF9148_01097 [Prevotella sp. F0091]|nr:hypothetical protein HMPREF9148_01097 [Prevotella sp. F0091]